MTDFPFPASTQCIKSGLFDPRSVVYSILSRQISFLHHLFLLLPKANKSLFNPSASQSALKTSHVISACSVVVYKRRTEEQKTGYGEVLFQRTTLEEGFSGSLGDYVWESPVPNESSIREARGSIPTCTLIPAAVDSGVNTCLACYNWYWMTCHLTHACHCNTQHWSESDGNEGTLVIESTCHVHPNVLSQ